MGPSHGVLLVRAVNQALIPPKASVCSKTAARRPRLGRDESTHGPRPETPGRKRRGTAWRSCPNPRGPHIVASCVWPQKPMSASGVGFLSSAEGSTSARHDTTRHGRAAWQGAGRKRALRRHGLSECDSAMSACDSAQRVNRFRRTAVHAPVAQDRVTLDSEVLQVRDGLHLRLHMAHMLHRMRQRRREADRREGKRQ